MNSTVNPIPDAEIRMMVARRVSIAKIARTFGCSPNTIRARLDRLGIPRSHYVSPKKRDPTPAEIEKLKAECLARRAPEERRPERWTPPHLSWDGQAFRVLG
jgi:transposase-like protein